jgi:hypothetical protein
MIETVLITGAHKFVGESRQSEFKSSLSGESGEHTFVLKTTTPSEKVGSFPEIEGLARLTGNWNNRTFPTQNVK